MQECKVFIYRGFKILLMLNYLFEHPYTNTFS